MPAANMQQLGLKIAQSVLYVLGYALTVYNLFAFKLTKAGSIYYNDTNQLWLALGVGMIASAYIIRNWNKT